MNPVEFLKSYHPALVSRNEDINVELSYFHNQASEALRKYEASVTTAAKVNTDFTAEATQRDQQDQLYNATADFQAAVDKAAQPYKQASNKIRQEIETASRPGTQKTETAELIALMKAQEIRRVMEGMPLEERAKILRATVAAGDASVLHALEESIVPLIPAPIMELSRQTYQEKALPDKVQALELAEAFAESVETTQRFVEFAARGIAKTAGIEEAFNTRNTAQKNKVAIMTPTEKTAFISENGLDAFKALLF